ncbi:hypothetical protein AAIB41_00215 [Brucella sp. BE17]|uniref:hypothetical protein n=1 Tax=Brucella sp. BE17 TaxID=3142977 RepID=UPI0031B9C4EF
MVDGVIAPWYDTPQQVEHTAHKQAYVFLGIMLAGLSVPAAFLGWALFHAIMIYLQ